MSGDLVTVFTASFGLFAAFVIGGFILLFSEIRRLETKLDSGFAGLRTEMAEQRAEMQQEFRAQRAEVSAQVAAIAAAINASRA